ncbi:MAG: hypothetical protein ACE5JR_11145 [Gemmatimonadota bacterium]
MKIPLRAVAIARSGDKGDTANIGLIALTEELYPVLAREVTAERVKEHFRGICHGQVERFELPNLRALNFLLHRSLGGGGTVSLMLDAQGKTFGAALLRMRIEAPEEMVARAAESVRGIDEHASGAPAEAGRDADPERAHDAGPPNSETAHV